MTSGTDIDAAIMAVIMPRWQKVAMVIARVTSRYPDGGDPKAEEVARRIEALIDQGTLQCQGNPKRWRYSEVRLPPEQIAE